MSLYNLIAGYNPLSGSLMAMLGFSTRDAGRFRDCYLQRSEDGQLEIHVYTRNGGGNRPDYVDASLKLMGHPAFLREYDDSYDTTYRSYVFTIPNGPEFPGIAPGARAGVIRQMLEDLVKVDPELIPPPPKERMDRFMAKMETNPNDPDVQRVKAAFAPIAAAIVGDEPPPDDPNAQIKLIKI